MKQLQDTLTKEQQIRNAIDESASIVICLPKEPTTDAIASGLALLSVLEKLGKRARVVSSGFQLPLHHSFLPKSDEIFDDIPSLRRFVISLDVSKTSVEEVSYTVENDRLNIYISPKDGFFSDTDVRTSAGGYSYDLIITVDTPSLDALGKVYDDNIEFFHETPIINIDHSPHNQRFGQITVLTLTAISTSEIIFEMIKGWKDGLLDEFIATHLLTGMISKTKSFQSGNITPRSMAIASHLIEQGARREEIVAHLYQSKKLNTLQLWGRVLSKIESDTKNKIVWSVVQLRDFEETGTQKEDVPDVIDELIINTPDAAHVFIIIEKEKGEHLVYVSTTLHANLLELFADKKPVGSDHFISFEEKKSAKEIQTLVHERIQKSVK